jgi:hypothetical protein
MSQFVTPDCLVKHRDVPHLKLHDGNAFQNVGDFIPTRDMNRLRIERQFKSQMKIEPSPFISMFDSFGKISHAVVHTSTDKRQERPRNAQAPSTIEAALLVIVSISRRSELPVWSLQLYMAKSNSAKPTMYTTL